MFLPDGDYFGAMRMADAQRIAVESGHRKRRRELLVVGGVLAVLAGVLAYAARGVWTGQQRQPGPAAKPQAMVGPAIERPAEPASDLVDDDGKTLWAAPTDGPPLDLAYLPPGVEIILALRPAKLLAHPEGEKVLAALGPLGEEAVAMAEHAIVVKFNNVERLLVGWQVARDGSYVATLVVTTQAPLAPQSNHYQPERGQGHLTVVAPPSALADIGSLEGRAPPLARDLERLLPHTDASRDMTLLARPRALLGDTSNAFRDETAPLRRPLEWFLGRSTSAAALSMNWDENFFLELVVVPTLDSSPEQLSDELDKRVDEMPNQVEDFVLGLDASPYSRRVVARLPEMVRRLAGYTRHGFDRDAAVLRCYLPAVAGHNLLMGAELALAEGQGRGAQQPGGAPLAESSAPASIEARLQQKTSLRFTREELEAALNMLAQDVGVAIKIRGHDLQLDGITRNQLFAIDISDQSAEAILVEILRRANPDKMAAGPADPRQKLVYVVGPEAIYITTRAAAAQRGEPLPAVFQPK